jgi:hypothetical protein
LWPGEDREREGEREREEEAEQIVTALNLTKERPKRDEERERVDFELWWKVSRKCSQSESEEDLMKSGETD